MLSEWIERMYRADVVACASPQGEWQRTCGVVPKSKPGTFRIVVDMRKPNTQFVEKFAPVKPIQHLLQEIQAAGSQYFSVFDIQHAFFSIHYKD